jgi:nucleosome assembly protein 1-like 1
MHLTDIECSLHEHGYGFDLIFRFEKNDYFTDAELKKSFTMSKQNVIEKCDGTNINWKDGRNVTQKKIKKKSKNKKAGAKTVTKTVEQESFFNFFKTLEMPTEDQLKATLEKAEKDEHNEEEEKDIGEKMDIDYDLGNEFKDQLIPLALEYYMEVIADDEDEEGDEGSCDSEDGHDHGLHHHGKSGKGGKKDDSDEDEDEKPAKGGNKKGGKKGG